MSCDQTLSRRQRLNVSHLNLRNSPQIAGYSSETGTRRFVSNCVVADAVRIEPVSASEFPDMPESAGNFCNLQGIWPCDTSETADRSCNYGRNSLRNEAGNFRSGLGTLEARAAKLRLGKVTPAETMDGPEFFGTGILGSGVDRGLHGRCYECLVQHRKARRVCPTCLERNGCKTHKRAGARKPGDAHWL
jgi:hypothetical protein